MDQDALVFIELNGASHFVGRLWTHRSSRGQESATFEYDPAWRAQPDAFALEPALQLGPGKFHTRADQRVFGAIGDSAPDRWGRMLMQRAERQRAKALKETLRTLGEVDYLLMVNDEARLGALRFKKTAEGDFLASGTKSIPPLVELPKLLTAAEKASTDDIATEELRILLAPGSSLGGARPKASVRDKDGSLTIAKFPNKQDEVDTVGWEAVALTLAKKSGIQVPIWRLEKVGKRRALLLQRFDRSRVQRIPFLSAMSMLGGLDNETHSYMEIADALRQYGAERAADTQQLWQRIVFSVLISNTDDHLRNHGFLYSGPKGWRLSPAYDLNPVPADIRPRVLSTTIDEADGTCSVDLLLSVAEYFEVPSKSAKTIIKKVAKAVSNWRREAAALGIAKHEIERMASAFEHADLEDASKF